MRNIATIPARDREALFRNTAAKMGMSEAIIEKDFWVMIMPSSSRETLFGGMQLSRHLSWRHWQKKFSE